ALTGDKDSFVRYFGNAGKSGDGQFAFRRVDNDCDPRSFERIRDQIHQHSVELLGIVGSGGGPRDQVDDFDLAHAPQISGVETGILQGDGRLPGEYGEKSDHVAVKRVLFLAPNFQDSQRTFADK